MSRQLKSLQSKLNLAKENKVVVKEVKEVKSDGRHLIFLTNEHKYKIETVLYFSLPVGSKQSIKYKKSEISDEILKDLSLMKLHLGYLFFSKDDGTYIPIKEFIVTDVKEHDDEIECIFLVGTAEDETIRKKHSFKIEEGNAERLVFYANFV